MVSNQGLNGSLSFCLLKTYSISHSVLWLVLTMDDRWSSILKFEVASSMWAWWSFSTNGCTNELDMACWLKGSYITKLQSSDRAVVWGGLQAPYEELAGMANLKQTYGSSRKCWKEYFFQLVSDHLGILPAGKKGTSWRIGLLFLSSCPWNPDLDTQQLKKICLGASHGHWSRFIVCSWCSFN